MKTTIAFWGPSGALQSYAYGVWVGVAGQTAIQPNLAATKPTSNAFLSQCTPRCATFPGASRDARTPSGSTNVIMGRRILFISFLETGASLQLVGRVAVWREQVVRVEASQANEEQVRLVRERPPPHRKRRNFFSNFTWFTRAGLGCLRAAGLHKTAVLVRAQCAVVHAQKRRNCG